MHFGKPCRQRRFRSECASAQADLNISRAHMPEGTFSDVAALLIELMYINIFQLGHTNPMKVFGYMGTGKAQTKQRL